MIGEASVVNIKQELQDDEITVLNVRRVLVNLGLGSKKVFFVDNMNTLVGQINRHIFSEPALYELLNQSSPVLQEYNPKLGKWVDLYNEENLGDGAVARLVFLPKAAQKEDVKSGQIEKEWDESRSNSKQKKDYDKRVPVKRESDDSNCDGEQKTKFQRMLSEQFEQRYCTLDVSSQSTEKTIVSTIPTQVSKRPLQHNVQTMRINKAEGLNTQTLISNNNTPVKQKPATSGLLQRLPLQENNTRLMSQKSHAYHNAWTTNQNEQAPPYPPNHFEWASPYPPNHFEWASPYPFPNNYQCLPPYAHATPYALAPPGWCRENYVWINNKVSKPNWCRKKYVWVNKKIENQANNDCSDLQNKATASNDTKPILIAPDLSKQITWKSGEICQKKRIRRLFWGDTIKSVTWQNVIFSDAMGFVVKRGKIKLERNGHPNRVMFWACVSQNSLKELGLVGDKTTCKNLVHFLNNQILEYILKHNKKNQKPLTISITGKYKSAFESNVIRDFLKNHNVLHSMWPMCVRDINPLEHVWKYIAAKVKSIHCNSKDHMISIIQNAWEKDPDINLMCEKFISSLPQIINCMVEQKGNNPNITIAW